MRGTLTSLAVALVLGGSGAPADAEETRLDFTVAESATSGTVVGQIAGAPATDAAASRTTFQLMTPGETPFQIDRKTGELTLGETTLDHEQHPAYVFSVRIRTRKPLDAAGRAFVADLLDSGVELTALEDLIYEDSEQLVGVTVTDAPEPPVLVADPVTLNVSSEADDSHAYLSVHDPDAADTHMFELLAGDVERFHINPVTGELVWKASPGTSGGTFPLTVQVTDSSGLSDSATINVEVVLPPPVVAATPEPEPVEPPAETGESDPTPLVVPAPVDPPAPELAASPEPDPVAPESVESEVPAQPEVAIRPAKNADSGSPQVAQLPIEPLLEPSVPEEPAAVDPVVSEPVPESPSVEPADDHKADAKPVIATSREPAPAAAQEPAVPSTEEAGSNLAGTLTFAALAIPAIAGAVVGIIILVMRRRRQPEETEPEQSTFRVVREARMLTAATATTQRSPVDEEQAPEAAIRAGSGGTHADKDQAAVHQLIAAAFHQNAGIPIQATTATRETGSQSATAVEDNTDRAESRPAVDDKPEPTAIKLPTSRLRDQSQVAFDEHADQVQDEEFSLPEPAMPATDSAFAAEEVDIVTDEPSSVAEPLGADPLESLIEADPENDDANSIHWESPHHAEAESESDDTDVTPDPDVVASEPSNDAGSEYESDPTAHADAEDEPAQSVEWQPVHEIASDALAAPSDEPDLPVTPPAPDEPRPAEQLDSADEDEPAHEPLNSDEAQATDEPEPVETATQTIDLAASDFSASLRDSLGTDRFDPMAQANPAEEPAAEAATDDEPEQAEEVVVPQADADPFGAPATDQFNPMAPLPPADEPAQSVDWPPAAETDHEDSVPTSEQLETPSHSFESDDAPPRQQFDPTAEAEPADDAPLIEASATDEPDPIETPTQTVDLVAPDVSDSVRDDMEADRFDPMAQTGAAEEPAQSIDWTPVEAAASEESAAPVDEFVLPEATSTADAVPSTEEPEPLGETVPTVDLVAQESPPAIHEASGTDRFDPMSQVSSTDEPAQSVDWPPQAEIPSEQALPTDDPPAFDQPYDAENALAEEEGVATQELSALALPDNQDEPVQDRDAARAFETADFSAATPLREEDETPYISNSTPWNVSQSGAESDAVPSSETQQYAPPAAGIDGIPSQQREPSTQDWSPLSAGALSDAVDEPGYYDAPEDELSIGPRLSQTSQPTEDFVGGGGETGEFSPDMLAHDDADRTASESGTGPEADEEVMALRRELSELFGVPKDRPVSPDPQPPERLSRTCDFEEVGDPTVDLPGEGEDAESAPAEPVASEEFDPVRSWQEYLKQRSLENSGQPAAAPAPVMPAPPPPAASIPASAAASPAPTPAATTSVPAHPTAAVRETPAAIARVDKTAVREEIARLRSLANQHSRNLLAERALHQRARFAWVAWGTTLVVLCVVGLIAIRHESGSVRSMGWLLFTGAGVALIGCVHGFRGLTEAKDDMDDDSVMGAAADDIGPSMAPELMTPEMEARLREVMSAPEQTPVSAGTHDT